MSKDKNCLASSLGHHAEKMGVLVPFSVQAAWLVAPLERQKEIEVEYGVLWRQKSSYEGMLLKGPIGDAEPEPEYTGGSSSYYQVKILHPTTKDNPPYTAECNDIIEALGMNYAEGNAFKAIWRRAAAEFLGVKKRGYDSGLYDAEKVEFYGHRMVIQSQAKLQKDS
jgi:hypothetical protein